MDGLGIWKRLLWKEIRESWGVVVMMLALPYVMFTLADRSSMGYTEYTDLLRATGSLGTYILLVLWAVGKGDRGRAGNQFSLSHLPVKPTRFWWTSFVVPALISALLGAWFGKCSTVLTSWNDGRGVAAGALEFVSMYSFCYYLSTAISKWLAILIGVTHVVSGGSLISTWNLDVIWIRQAMLFVTAVAVGAFVASYLFAWLANRKTLQVRQAISLGVMVVIALLPFAEGIDTRGSVLDRKEPPSDTHFIECSSRFYSVKGGAPGRIVVRSFSTKIAVVHKMPHPAVAVDVTDEGKVYLVQQKKDSKMIEVLLWDSRSDRTERLAAIPAGRKALAEYSGASLDPKRRYILMFVGDLIGRGNDAWLVDLKKGNGQIIVPCVQDFRLETGNDLCGYDAVWTNHNLYLSNLSAPLIKVDLRTMKAEPFDVFGDEGRHSR